MDQFTQLLRGAQGGHGVENLASLYGISAQQTQRAMEALMPAFAAAMQRAMQSPDGMANLTVLMMSGPYGGLYEHAPSAPGELSKPGATAMDAVFGSPEVARAVAEHAATSSGLATAVVNQVMPSFATLLLGGMAKSLAASGAMSQLLAASLARASGQPLPTGNPWIDALGNFLTPSKSSAPQSTGNPWIDSFAQMMVQSPFGLRGAASKPGANPWQALAESISASMSNFQLPQQTWAPPQPAPKPVPMPPPQPQAQLGFAGPLPFQDYFAQLFAQGFPPGYSPFEAAKSQATPTGFYPFDFWSQMLDRSSGGGRSGPKR